MKDEIIDKMFLEKEDIRMNKIRTQLILNGVLEPKQINKKKSTKKNKKKR